MAVLGPGLQTLAGRLILWDRNRVAKHVADGYDCTLWSARIDLAEACISLDTDAWPQDIKFYYMVVLEVTRTAIAAKQFGIGPLGAVVPHLTLAQRLAYRAFADSIGVRDRLKETSPMQWGDVDVEGA
jgi:hypothetical protein